MKKLHEKLRELRKSKGISQKKIADNAGISIAAYSNIESGISKNISIEVGKAISHVLEIPFNDLFEIEDNRELIIKKQQNQINELEESIKELQNAVKNTRFIIDALRKERNKLLEDNTYIILDQIFDFIVEDEIQLRKSNSEQEKEGIKIRLQNNFRDLNYEIEKSIEKEILTKEKILDVFFTNNSFFEIIENESNSRKEFIQKAHDYINQIYIFSKDLVQNYIENECITKWDNSKIKKRNIRIKKLLHDSSSASY